MEKYLLDELVQYLFCKKNPSVLNGNGNQKYQPKLIFLLLFKQ